MIHHLLVSCPIPPLFSASAGPPGLLEDLHEERWEAASMDNDNTVLDEHTLSPHLGQLGYYRITDHRLMVTRNAGLVRYGA